MSTTLLRPFLCFVLFVHRSGGFAMICAFTTIPWSTPGWWNRRRWASLTDRDERRETGKMLGVRRINKRSPPNWTRFFSPCMTPYKMRRRKWFHDLNLNVFLNSEDFFGSFELEFEKLILPKVGGRNWYSSYPADNRGGVPLMEWRVGNVFWLVK